MEPTHIGLSRDDGARLSADFWEGGSGLPLLILDGIGCFGWAFRRILPELLPHRSIVLPHYRGHGRSPNPPRPWRLDMQVLADDAAALLDRLGLPQVVVVGFSMGFQVSLELVRRHPKRVAGMVNIAGPSGRALQNFQGTDSFRHALPLMLAATKNATRLSLRVWQTLAPSTIAQRIGLATQVNAHRLPHSDFDVYMRGLSEIHPELFVSMLERAHRHSAAAVLPTIRVPAAILAGARDKFVPLSSMREIAFSIPHADWHVFPDATHALPAEFPLEVARRIEALAREAEQQRTA